MKTTWVLLVASAFLAIDCPVQAQYRPGRDLSRRNPSAPYANGGFPLPPVYMGPSFVPGVSPYRYVFPNRHWGPDYPGAGAIPGDRPILGLDDALPGVPGVGFGNRVTPWGLMPVGPEPFARPGANDLRGSNGPRERSQDEMLRYVMSGKCDPKELSQLVPQVNVQQLNVPKLDQFETKKQKPSEPAELPSWVCWESAALLFTVSLLAGILCSFFGDRSK